MPVIKPNIQGHFIASSHGKVFVTQFGAITDKTAIVCLPSITEELNLARAVIAKQAIHFAQQQLASFVLDYSGTGDSHGEFGDVNADIWLQDVLSLGQWLQSQGVERIILWGVRFGALLALHHQQQLHEKLPIVSQLFWKPVLNGKQFMGQFLRIKQANAMMQGNSKKVNWRQEVLSGKTIEVAGYCLNAQLLQSLENLCIGQSFKPQSKLNWIELASSQTTPLINRTIDAWDRQSYSMAFFDSPAFWQVPEVFDLPDLYSQSLSMIEISTVEVA